MPTINKIVPEMDLACRKHLETICHTRNSKKQLKSDVYETFMAAVFTLKIYVPLNKFWYIFKILLPDDLEIR